MIRRLFVPTIVDAGTTGVQRCGVCSAYGSGEREAYVANKVLVLQLILQMVKGWVAVVFFKPKALSGLFWSCRVDHRQTEHQGLESQDQILCRVSLHFIEDILHRQRRIYSNIRPDNLH
jgi:hypothetical protein